MNAKTHGVFYVLSPPALVRSHVGLRPYGRFTSRLLICTPTPFSNSTFSRNDLGFVRTSAGFSSPGTFRTSTLLALTASCSHVPHLS